VIWWLLNRTEVAMRECRGATYVGFFLVGLAMGAAAAVLLAPKSGKETRRYLSRRAEDGRDFLAARGKGLRRQAEDVVNQGRDWATKLVQ
jgi:gas vesicle protein